MKRRTNKSLGEKRRTRTRLREGEGRDDILGDATTCFLNIHR